MSDSAANPAGAGKNDSPCCAVIAELQRRVQQRAEQRPADGDAAAPAASPEPTRDA